MPAIVNVFNMGTNHAQGEINNTIAALYEDCSGTKIINDGVGTRGNKARRIFTQAMGLGMDSPCRRTVDEILSHDPVTVNMTGHSRGAALCHMIANDLGDSRDPRAKKIQCIRMFLIDPVHMSNGHDHRASVLRWGVKLKKYFAFMMTHEGSLIYPPNVLTPGALEHRRMQWYLPMPGTHGTATQNLTNAVGRAAFEAIKKEMHGWGTTFQNQPESYKVICDRFADIHLSNRATWKNGSVVSRSNTDDKGDAQTSVAAVTENRVAKSRVAVLKQIFENSMTKSMLPNFKEQVNFHDTLYFFNELHALYFYKSWPMLYKRMIEQSAFNPGVNARKFQKEFNRIQSAVDLDLQDIKRHYKNIWLSLKHLGML